MSSGWPQRNRPVWKEVTTFYWQDHHSLPRRPLLLLLLPPIDFSDNEEDPLSTGTMSCREQALLLCVCAYQPLPSALAVMIWIIKILNSNNNNNSELKITRNRTRVWCRRSFLWSLFHSFKASVFNLVYKSCIQLSTGWYSQKFPCRFMD